MAGGPKLLYVVTEDWFFCSHFLPMARAARAAGFDVAVACRLREKEAVLRAEGLRVIPVEAERGDKGPASLLANIRRLAGVFSAEKPDVVHFISLRPVLLGGLVARWSGVRRRVFAVTGLGPLNGPATAKRRLAFAAVRLCIRLIGGRGARFLFENQDDPRRLGLDPDDPLQVAVVGGAGVDPDAFSPSPEPAAPPLRAAIVARMLWTKGIDAAVEGVGLARDAGVDVTLSLYGAPDPSNATSISLEELDAWAARPGIQRHGPTSDVAGVWRTHHVALLPSHGEGMPRMLVEAAACGRPIVASDVSGCRALVRDGVEGFLVPVGDARAVATALGRLAADPDLRARMGSAGRARVLSGFTERQVGEAVATLYATLLREA